MADLSGIKAVLDGLGVGLIDVAAVVKKKESLLASGADLVGELMNDQSFKDQVAKVMAVGLAGLLAEVKSMPSDVEADLQLALAEVPLVQKVIASFKA